MDYIIGVDIGTSGTKTVAFDMKGDVLRTDHVTYPILNPQPHYFEQDPEVLFEAVIRAIGQTVQGVNRQTGNNSDLLGVGFSSAMHGIIAMDKQGIPLTHCIIWTDTRATAFASQLSDTPEGSAIYRATGTPIHPMSPLCKLGWMRMHLPAVHAAAYKFISVKEYVFLRLFGRYVIDESIASATGLFDIHQFNWHPAALEIAGISADRLAEPVPITYCMEGMDEHLAARMGIAEDVPFVIGGSDGCLANLGADVIQPGAAAVTIGTSGAVRMTSDRPRTDDKARTFSYVLTRELHVLGGAVNNGGIVLQWFKDSFEPAAVSSDAAFHGLMDAAAGVPAGSEGLLFLPYLTGERSPHWNAEAKGMFFGVQLHHRKAHFVRALLEGVIFGVYSVGRVLEEITGPIHTIHANGGFAYSSLWLQVLADVFDRPVHVRKNVEAAARGAYVTVLNALGKRSTFIDIADQPPPSEIILPSPARHEVYRVNFERFERLYDKVKDEFN
ncbi:gluconokinase [Parapedobacter lycopersici]|uniref:gluconokinase n=1 Tax=Parapedobacter lycopersici TaxID=1864939 RepID=UPI0033419995